MTGIAEFLSARLDEDERDAKNAVQEGLSGDAPWMAERMVREAEAKRKILGEHYTRVSEHLRGHPRYGYDHWCMTCSHDNPSFGWCATLTALAAIYSDHPDCRPEWKPEGSPP